jgi:hypothetical protein
MGSGAASTFLFTLPYFFLRSVSTQLLVNQPFFSQGYSSGASHIIFATNLNLATDTITTAYTNMVIAIEPAIEAGNLTAVEHAMLLSPEAETMQMIFANIGMNWYEDVANLITYANGNVSLVGPLMTGETFSALSQMFTNYGFEPNVSPVRYVNCQDAVSHSLSPDAQNEYCISPTRMCTSTRPT